MLESTECHLIDGDEDDDASVHSAVSNDSDFEEDEEVDYLALELVHYLPPDKATKLLKNMRTKEKAVQDLVHRNRMLLESCHKLDDENQVLSERLKEAEKEPCKSAAQPATTQPVAAPAVDNSIFLKLERGKEEQILTLRNENERLKMQVRRLHECEQQLEDSLVETRKELKKLQQQMQKRQEAPVSGGAPRVDKSVLDEEERIYRELQGTTGNDLITQKMQQRQAENHKRLQEILQALLSDDLQRIKGWSSDVAAVMMAVEGMEVRLRQGHKDQKEPRESKDPKSQKKGKASSGPSHSGSSHFSSEQIMQVSVQILDDFDSMRSQLEDADKAQLSLEQTARGLHDEADQAIAATGLDESLAAAEREAEWMRSHNAAWVEHAQALSLEPMVSLLGRTEAAVRSLLSSAPPGLIPPNAEGCLQETCEQIAELSSRLGGQAAALTALQEESISFGRRVKVLQNLQRTLRSNLQGRMAEELRRSAGAVEQPLERIRVGLRQQSEAIMRARSRVSGALEGLAEAARRAAAADSTGSSAGDPRASGDAAVPDAIFSEFREVRTMGKSLIANLEDGGKALNGRMEQVIAVINGEAPSGGGDKARTSTAPGAASGAGDEPRAAASEAKRKKGKKKGRTEPDQPPGGLGHTAAASAGAEGQQADCSSGNRPSGSSSAAAPPRSNAAADSDAQLRAEFHEVFKDSKEGVDTAQRGDAGDSADRSGARLTGPELLHELQSLRNDAEALEARMAERLRARADGAEGDDPQEGGAAKPKAQRRKKMYA